MNIRENMIIDIETEVSDSESDSKTLKFLVDEDLKDLGYNVHSLQVQPAKRHPDPNGVLPLTEKEVEEMFYILDIPFYKHEEFDEDDGDVFEVKIVCEEIEYFISNEYKSWKEKVTNYKAILYIANLFELEVTE